MLSAVRMAILAASTVGACSDTSRIFLSTNSASSRMYAGSPAARTEYVWPKISTCVTAGRVRLFEHLQEALDARADGGPIGLVLRESGGRSAVLLARLAGRRELGLEARVLPGEALHDLHERFQARLDCVEDLVERGLRVRFRLAFAAALGLFHMVLLRLLPSRRPLSPREARGGAGPPHPAMRSRRLGRASAGAIRSGASSSSSRNRRARRALDSGL